MKERTSEGIAIAKTKGKYKGRKRGANTDIKSKKEDLIRLVQSKLDDNHSIKNIAETTKGITRPTIYSYIKKGLLIKDNGGKEQKLTSEKLKHLFESMRG